MSKPRGVLLKATFLNVIVQALLTVGEESNLLSPTERDVPRPLPASPAAE